MTIMFEQNRVVFDSFVAAYNALPWYSGWWDASKQLKEAIQSYKPNNLESAFSIYSSYNTQQKAYSNPALQSLAKSNLLKGLSLLADANICSRQSQFFFNILIAHNEPLLFATIIKHCYQYMVVFEQLHDTKTLKRKLLINLSEFIYLQAINKQTHDKEFALDKIVCTDKHWAMLGDQYYDECNENSEQIKIAFICYQEAIKLNPNYFELNYRLGWMHQHCKSIPIDLDQAKKQYEIAERFEHYAAIRQLIRLNYSFMSTADSWYRMGKEYYVNEIECQSTELSMIKAWCCFERAMEINTQHVLALHGIGLISHNNTVKVNTLAQAYYKKTLGSYPAASVLESIVLKNPDLIRLTSLQLQNHVVELSIRLKKIETHYPWVFVADFCPQDTTEDMIDFDEDIEAFCDGFSDLLNKYQTKFTEYVDSLIQNIFAIKLENSIPRDELIESAQILWKRFAQYLHNITHRSVELLGPDAPPCIEEKVHIEMYLSTFEKGLDELSSLTLTYPFKQSNFSLFFSLGNYLSTLSKTNSTQNFFPKDNQELLNVIHFLEKIAIHHECTEALCLSIILLIIDANKTSKHEKKREIANVLSHTTHYTFFTNRYSANETIKKIEELKLDNLNIPMELNTNIQ